MIALFDSGYGGLTVLKPILKALPEYDYLYLGDSARVPYGNRSPEMIKKFAEEAVEYLFKRGAKVIIFACNAVSSVALSHVQQKYITGAQGLPADRQEHERAHGASANKAKNLALQVLSRSEPINRKILGVVIPMAEEVVKVTKNGRVGLIGTRATVNSKVYEKEISKICEKQNHSPIKLYSQATPLLVPLIEEDYHKQPEAITILKKYLKPLKSANIDTLILGCTHYPLMLKAITRGMGKKVKVLQSGEITAKSLKDYLSRHPEIEKQLKKSPSTVHAHPANGSLIHGTSSRGTLTILTTDDPAKFKTFTEKHFGMKIKMPERVVL